MDEQKHPKDCRIEFRITGVSSQTRYTYAGLVEIKSQLATEEAEFDCFLEIHGPDGPEVGFFEEQPESIRADPADREFPLGSGDSRRPADLPIIFTPQRQKI